MVRVSIILIAVILVAGMVGCDVNRESYTLTISSTSGGSVAEPGEGTFTYYEGTAVNLVAAVAETEPAYDFVGWTGDTDTVADTTAATTTITMNDNYTITANFALGIRVRDWYDLNTIRDDMYGIYILMNDLDSTTPGYEELAGPTANGGKGWQPIGTEDDWFTGTFDGQGYEIRDLFINRPNENWIGLFLGVDEEGVVENIGLVNATITGNVGVGGLAVGNSGNLTNCYATGSVTGYAYVGGLMAGNGGTVSYCYATGSVTGTGTVEYLGSVVGGLMAGNSYGTVNHSYFVGDVTGVIEVGGLVGFNERGSVSDSYAIGSTTGSAAVGGLVGVNCDTLSESYSIVSVTGNSSVGGLVGMNGGIGTVVNCYSAGSAAGNDGIGGLVGTDSYGTVTNSYSTGSVSGNSSVGGLVGSTDHSTVTNSFWDTETSGQSTSTGGIGKTTEEMQDITTFTGVGWNITAVADSGVRNVSYIWNIVDELTYPFLSWQS